MKTNYLIRPKRWALLGLSLFLTLTCAQAQTTNFYPVVTIRATDPNAAEPHDPGEFTVFRDGPTNNALSVFYQVGGTASNGVDYASLSHWVSIPAGEHAAPIPVLPIHDVQPEP